MVAEGPSQGSSHEKEDATERSRTILNEILVTGIIFGLTLNLISDFIIMLPTLVVDLPYLAYAASLAIGAILATVWLLVRLANQYLGEQSRFDEEFMLSFVWDISKGEVLERATAYRPQQIARELSRVLSDDSREKLRGIVTQGPEALLASDLNMQMSEAVLIDALITITKLRGKEEKQAIVKSLYDHENIFITKEMQEAALSFPGEWDLSYRRHSKDDSELILRWKRGYHGAMRVELRFGRVSWFENVPDDQLPIMDDLEIRQLAEGIKEMAEKMAILSPQLFGEKRNLDFPETAPTPFIQCLFRVHIYGQFSPIRLHFRRFHVQELAKWTRETMGALQSMTDWTSFRSGIIQGRMAAAMMRARQQGQGW